MIWSMRLNVTLIGIIIVDSIFLGLGARGAIGGLQSDFYEELATDLVLSTMIVVVCVAGRVLGSVAT
jgi:hypothetical protein